MAFGVEQAQPEYAAAFGAGDASELDAAVFGNVRAIDHGVGRVQQLGLRLCRATRLRLYLEAATGSNVGRWLQRDPAERCGCCLPAHVARQRRVAIACDQAGANEGERGGGVLAQPGGQVGDTLPIRYIARFRQQQQRTFAGRRCAHLVGLGAEHDQAGGRSLMGRWQQAEIQQRGSGDLQRDDDPAAAWVRCASTQLAHAGDDHDQGEQQRNPQARTGGVHGCASSASRYRCPIASAALRRITCGNGRCRARHSCARRRWRQSRQPGSMRSCSMAAARSSASGR